MSVRLAASSYLALGRDIPSTAAIVRAAGYDGIEWRVQANFLAMTLDCRPAGAEAVQALASRQALAADDLARILTEDRQWVQRWLAGTS